MDKKVAVKDKDSDPSEGVVQEQSQTRDKAGTSDDAKRSRISSRTTVKEPVPDEIPLGFVKAESLQGFFDAIDVRKVFLGIRRRLGYIVACGALFGIIFGVVSYLMMNKFTSTVLLLHVRTMPQTRHAGYKPVVFTPQTIVEMLRLPQHYQAAKSILGLDLSVQAVASMVNVATTRTSNLLSLTVTSDNESLSIDLANTLAQVAVKSSKDLHFRQAQADYEYFTNKTEEIHKKQIDLGRQINEYKSENQLFEVDVETMTASSLDSLRKRQQNADIQYETLLVEYENLQRELAEMPELVVAYQYEESPLKSRISSTEMSLLNARTKYGPDNPKVRLLEEELSQLRKLATESNLNESREQVYEKNELKENLSIELLRLEGTLRAAQRRKEKLGEELLKSEQYYQDVPREQMYLAQLIQRRSAVEEQLIDVEAKRRAAEVAMETRSGDLEIYQAAEKAKPVDGMVVKFLPLVGFILGCGAATFLFLLIELADRKFRTTKQLGLTYRLPCILGVPEVSGLADDNGDDSLLFYTRSLAERLERMTKSPNLGSVVFTSAIAREGKTSLAFHMARYYQRMGVKTVFVEFDYRKNRFRSPTASVPSGIEKYLRGDVSLADVIAPGEPDYLKVGYDAEMKELVQSGYMKRLWESLTDAYDLVVVDGPGLIDDDYALNIAEMADHCVFVIGSSKTRKNYVDASLQLLEISDVKPCGLVLNEMLPLYVEDPRIKRQWEKKRWQSLTRLFPWT